MKIIVTGANGYIGRNVVKELLKRNFEVFGIDISKSKDFCNERYHFIKCNILDEAELNGLFTKLSDADILLHLAWQDGFNHYAESHVNNLLNHFYFLKKAVDSGVKSLTVMGSVHEIGYHEGRVNENTPCRPLSYYGIAKNTLRELISAYLKDKDVSLKWLRGFYVLGDDYNNHSVFTAILKASNEGKKEFPFTKGTNQFDFIDINELAEQIASASVQNKIDGIINVCSGEPVSLKDKAEEFIKEKGLNIKLKYGEFPQREYDSPVIFGDNKKILKILEGSKNA